MPTRPVHIHRGQDRRHGRRCRPPLGVLVALVLLCASASVAQGASRPDFSPSALGVSAKGGRLTGSVVVANRGGKRAGSSTLGLKLRPRNAKGWRVVGSRRSPAL